VSRFDLTTNMLMENNVTFYERHGYRLAEVTHHCPRREDFDPPCRLNSDPGTHADQALIGCG